MAMAGGSADSYDLDALAVSDRFRLFNFTRRDDYLAYLWVLRAMDRLRGMHVAASAVLRRELWAFPTSSSMTWPAGYSSSTFPRRETAWPNG